jgi:Ring hydroxylating alpha subunit (catalytic domain)
VVWEPGWYLTYNYWPAAYDQHTFESSLYFAPAKTVRDKLRQELTTVTFKEFALQDCNTLEATQTMLESRRVSRFPIGDQEIMIRHLHHAVGEQVAAYQCAMRDSAMVAR